LSNTSSYQIRSGCQQTNFDFIIHFSNFVRRSVYQLVIASYSFCLFLPQICLELTPRHIIRSNRLIDRYYTFHIMACRMRMKSCKDYVYMATLVGGRALGRTQRTHGDIPENIERNQVRRCRHNI
jgi:hypothetical protein